MYGYISLQFLLIYRKARAGELEQDSGLSQLARLTEVDVDEVGVTGAKNFFEAKVCFFIISPLKRKKSFRFSLYLNDFYKYISKKISYI